MICKEESIGLGLTSLLLGGKNLTGKKWRVALPFTIHTVTDKIVKSIKRPSEMFLSIFQGLCKND